MLLHSTDENLATCLYCGKKYKPRASDRGKFCCREHHVLWRQRQIPDSWRAIHAWMKQYQVTRGLPPLIEEMLGVGGIMSKGGILHAIRKLRERGFMKIEGDPATKRRYRAQGVLPRKEVIGERNVG